MPRTRNSSHTPTKHRPLLPKRVKLVWLRLCPRVSWRNRHLHLVLSFDSGLTWTVGQAKATVGSRITMFRAPRSSIPYVTAATAKSGGRHTLLEQCPMFVADCGLAVCICLVPRLRDYKYILLRSLHFFPSMSRFLIH
ncbi:hypothetical protein P171DRAFT_212401 [Karstenula rhodostoma CBS 690.94]|uniref:Uncharacterized protein n=1 Tax=Karstenula rhodostoma CBS 690.94 TaxID=1392251 RepID=A0A9P4PQ86_9PLEO|nr:hypothetical protein P171DRAFT_212401 [Karstenula rhodostoma CBS 690.94]